MVVITRTNWFGTCARRTSGLWRFQGKPQARKYSVYGYRWAVYREVWAVQSTLYGARFGRESRKTLIRGSAAALLHIVNRASLRTPGDTPTLTQPPTANTLCAESLTGFAVCVRHAGRHGGRLWLRAPLDTLGRAHSFPRGNGMQRPLIHLSW